MVICHIYRNNNTHDSNYEYKITKIMRSMGRCLQETKEGRSAHTNPLRITKMNVKRNRLPDMRQSCKFTQLAQIIKLGNSAVSTVSFKWIEGLQIAECKSNSYANYTIIWLWFPVFAVIFCWWKTGDKKYITIVCVFY